LGSLVHICGAGPAGTAAALAALAEGCGVRLIEKSAFPRHKVCGEFLSPEVREVITALGVWEPFQAARPSAIRRVELHFPRTVKRWTLPEPAYGLSRFAMDHLLLDAAIARGAELTRDTITTPPAPAIVAHGRKLSAGKGRRLFGFKAHFRGPVNDAVELFFAGGGYAGVSAVENGGTNVCGLAPESTLRACGFRIDDFLAGWPRLRERTAPLTRAMEWLVTGPLVFGRNLDSLGAPGIYPAGDALGFIDPFTGSGILAALLTGRLAGRAAARGQDVPRYLKDCRESLGLQYGASTIVRAFVATGAAEWFAPLLPGRWLFEWTRPKTVALK
jgi:flavin-dependent dehydrogenase